MKSFFSRGKKSFKKLFAHMIIFSMLVTLLPATAVQAESAGPLSVYAEDFSEGTANGWTTYSGSDPDRQWDWSVNPQNQFAVSGNTGAKAIAEGTDFQDMIYEADIQVGGFNNDNSGLLFRVSEPSGNAGNGFNGYYAGIRVDKKLELGRVTGSDTWKSLMVTDMSSSYGHMKIKAVGNEIQIFVNDMSTPKIEYTDNDGSQITSSGAIGVRTYWGTSNVDNIRVREYSHIETPAPAFSIPEGIYNDPQTVEISAVGGAVIHYTTDGSMPDSNSPVYDSSIQLDQPTTIKAYAEKSGEMVSDIATAVYIVGNNTQVFSDDFEDGNADGWTTYKGLDNNQGTWSVSGGKYVLNNSKGDKALADGTACNNFIFEADVNPGAGNDSSGLVFRCSEPGDGCDNLSGYFAGINVNGYVQIGKMDSNANNGNGGWTELYRTVANVRANQHNHLRVYANGSHFYVSVNGEQVADFIDSDYPTGSIGVRGWNANGDVTFDNIRITGTDMLLSTVGTPSFSPASGAFETSQQVEITCSTPDAAIYYTIDGSMPTTASTVYSGAITLNDTATVKAIAAKAGMLNSSVQSAAFTKLSASFSDDFSSGNYDRWTPYGGTWSVSNKTLQVASGQGYKVIAKNTEFSNVSYEADLKITGGTGDTGVLFRVTGASVGGDNVVGYYAGINAGGDAVILGKMNNNWNELTRVSKAIDINKTYHMKVVAYGTLIKVFVDDMTTPVISFNDNTYTHGAIGLRIYNSAVAFGNIHAETYTAPALIESIKTAQVTTRAKLAPVMPEQVTALYNNGSEQSVNVTWDTITADKYENPGSFSVEGTVEGTALKATAKVTVAAAPLAPGEALPVANQGSLVKTPFIPLPLGSVKADGWLLQQLMLQKNGATGHAEEIYSELGSNSAWLGGNAASSDWERPVYYVKGLVALAYTLGDTELQDKAAKWIEWSLQSQKPDGSFGPSTSDDWWPRMPMLYAMRDYYEATGDQRVITFMTNYFHYQTANLPGRPLTDWSKARVGDNIDTVLWLYNRTNDESLLDLADMLKNQGYDHTSIFSNDNFFGFGSDFHPNHNVNVSEDIKMPAIYYQRSGNDADKNAFRLGDSHLLKYHGQITGMSSGTEFLAGLGSTQGAELCAIVERMQSNEEAQMILGDPYLGDQLEKIAFNALPGAVSKDFKLQQYYSLPNQVQSVNGSRGHRQDYANGLQPSPDSGFPCCRFDMHMGWPYYVKSMWAATDDGGIAAMAYGPSNVTTKINNTRVTITETTNYPFEEQLKFTVNTSADNSFPLKLRIPEWCKQPVVEVNGTAQTGVTSGEYYTIDRTWTDGDVVTFSLPMEVKTSTQVSNSVGVERGPLVYSLKIDENWKKVSERVSGYVEYEVLPATDWNYGLVIDSSNPDASFTVNKGEMPENPFIQGTTPVTLTAKAKKVTSWKLGPNNMDADEVPLGPVISAMPEENVTLVPFGAENIRVTYFPRIADQTSLMSKKYEAENAVLNNVEVKNGGNQSSTSVSNSKYVGKIDYADSSVLFNNIYARENGTYTLEIAYASGSAGYSTHKITVNEQPAGSVKYSPIDGWGKFSRTYVSVNLNKGNNTIQLVKGDNFAELDYIAVLNSADYDDVSGAAYHGLKAEYYGNKNLSGTPKTIKADETINFYDNFTSILENLAGTAENCSVRWTGRVMPEETAAYTFHMIGDNGFRLWVNNELLIDNWVESNGSWEIPQTSKQVNLEAGKKYDIKVEYFQAWGGADVKLEWSSLNMSKRVIPATCLYQPEGSELPIELVTIDSIVADTQLYAPPKLPREVTVKFKDGKTEKRYVTWNLNDMSVFDKKGTVNVTGNVSKTQTQVLAVVTVKDYTCWEKQQAPIETKWAAEVNENNALMKEYPRPQMQRTQWVNLNGLWKFAPGEETGAVDAVKTLPTGEATKLEREILVPYPMESALSGVMRHYDRAWYKRSFTVPADWNGKNIILNFGAVDWESEVFVNGQSVGIHKGGYDKFSYDITKYLDSSKSEQELIVRVYDPTDKKGYPRGKQTLNPGGIMYTPTTGIWQTVWMEPVSSTCGIDNLKIEPDVDNNRLKLTVNTKGTAAGVTVNAKALDGTTEVGTVSGAPNTPLYINVPNAKLWSPESPFLYDLKVELKRDSSVLDKVDSYFGMRKISRVTVDGYEKIFLNNKDTFLMGPLDQGFWPDGLYTAPTDEALKFDIEKEKELGYNMVRKHIKMEPERWYYWADKLGIMVWQDMPSENSYTSNPAPLEKVQYELELTKMVQNNWNSPSIIMWCVFNEWQGAYEPERLVELVRNLDSSRLINQGSGGPWADAGDIYDNHNYPPPSYKVNDPNFPNPPKKPQIVICGEYGGIGLTKPGHHWNEGGNFSYTMETDPKKLIKVYEDYANMLLSFKTNKGLCGAVYTEITDVEVEVNGIYTYDRVLKLNPEDVSTFRAINEKIINEVIAPIPPSKELKDDFNDGNANGWTNYGGVWKVEDGKYKALPDSGAKSLADNTNFYDFTYEADISIDKCTDDHNAGVIFRINGPGVGPDNYSGYYAGIGKTYISEHAGKTGITLGKADGSWTLLDFVPYVIEQGKTYRMKVVADGSNIKVYIDDILVVEKVDTSFKNGAIGFRTWKQDVSYDNVVVTAKRSIEIPKATDATLADLKVNGATVSGFNAATTAYNVKLPYGTTIVPTVTATANDTGKAKVQITQATVLPGSTVIVVTAEDGITVKTYKVNFIVEPKGNNSGNQPSAGGTQPEQKPKENPEQKPSEKSETSNGKEATDTTNKVRFKDVPESAWYYEAVTFVAEKGITSGTGDGKFSPNAQVTRAQALVMIMKAFGINPDEKAESNFSDAGNAYYTGYLAAAKRLGITGGVGGNKFAPDRKVTRQEMFVLMYNTLKNMNALPMGVSGKDLADFKDSGKISDYAKEAMTFFVNNGIVAGTDGKILPADSASRAQFVQVLYNIMKMNS